MTMPIISSVCSSLLLRGSPRPNNIEENMRRINGLSILVAVLAVIGASGKAVADEISSYASIQPSLALVMTREGRNVGFGTAFCVESAGGYGFLLTNKHVVGSDLHPFVVLMNDPKHVHTAGIVRAAEIDAIVLVIKSACEPLTISKTLPPVGTRIGLAGFPAIQLQTFFRGFGLTPSFHEGTISSVIGDGTILQYDAQTDRGNSGSPLFDIESGEVYGLVTAVSTGTTGALQNNMAIGAGALQPFLQNANHDIAVGLRTLGLSTEGSGTRVSPSPTQAPKSSSDTVGQAPQLTFQDGVNRLIEDAASQFMPDRGAKTHYPDLSLSIFAMTFNITGYTKCDIIVEDGPDRPPSAGCAAYEGGDMAQARQVYETAKATLAAFAKDAGGTITESLSKTDLTRVVTATYNAGGGVTARVILEQDFGVVLLSVDPPSQK
jgi:S1-C subfamily serine protease